MNDTDVVVEDNQPFRTERVAEAVREIRRLYAQDISPTDLQINQYIVEIIHYLDGRGMIITDLDELGEHLADICATHYPVLRGMFGQRYDVMDRE